tara:strand:+ start:2910 stop:3479 length:570 start_codon:yes stop_codon:yes gene_type:complete
MMKNSYYLWIIALVVVNTGWYAVSQQGAVQEINRPGADFSETREGELSTLIGSEVDFEIEHCFESINGGVYNASITVESESETLYSWEGTTDEGCITYSSTSDEGEFIVITLVEEGVETTATLTTWPMKSAFILGLILFSSCTVAVAFGETFVRALVKKKMDQEPTNDPAMADTFPESNGIWQDPVRPN